MGQELWSKDHFLDGYDNNTVIIFQMIQSATDLVAIIILVVNTYVDAKDCSIIIVAHLHHFY